jgi:hypothetical protein
MVSSIRQGRGVENAGGAVAWLRARPWLYAYVVLSLWAIVPGLRRIVDWKSSFSSVSIVSIVPLLSLIPAAAILFGWSRGTKIGRVPLVAAWLWLGAFGYAYAVGIATGNAVSATYTFLNFVLPMCFGVYVSTLDLTMETLYERIAKYALALSVPVALYAIYQYVAPPPWDLYWIQQTAIVSVGSAAAFSFKPFSTLNGPGAYADFILGVVILNLPRFRFGNLWRTAAIVLNIVTLSLTLVRADWIGLLLALLIFVALSPRKVQNLSSIAAVSIILVLFTANAAALFGNSQAAIDLQNRFASLTSLGTDTSYRDRLRYFGDALTTAASQPTGAGLGVVGTAAKLGAAGATVDFDNGYIARFTEMGYFGTAAYLATIGFVFVCTLSRWRTFSRSGNRPAAAIAAAMVGMQISLIFLDISGDHHNQFSGILFWLSLSILFAHRVGEKTDPLPGR